MSDRSIKQYYPFEVFFMRFITALGLAICLLFQVVSHAPADDKADARVIIDRAIMAQGGAAKLSKLSAHSWSEKGTYYGQGKGQPYTGKFAVQLPSQFRMEIEGLFTIVVDGDKGWVKAGGETKEMTKEQLTAQKENMYGGWVTTLLPLQDKAFTLTPLAEIKIDNRPAVGVKVAHKDHGDVTLYFDKGTGLPAKSVQSGRSEEQQGKRVQHERYYADFREIKGIKIPMKIVLKQDGKIFVESEMVDVQLAEKLDAKVFAKP